MTTSTTPPEPEVRILIADDEPDIRRMYERTLEGDPGDNTNDGDDMDELSEELFGAPSAKPSIQGQLPPGSLTFCSQADEVVEAVREAAESDRKYSMAFLDVRMPPGKDGIWAAENIREIDPDIQVVIVTGYSDIDPMKIAERVPPDDRLLYLQKPLHAFEIRQLVATLSSRCIVEQKWRHLNQNLADEVKERTAELMKANEELEQARRLKSVGRLAAGMAHEINTPLQFISDNLYFVRDAAEDLLKVAQHMQEFFDGTSEDRAAPHASAECRKMLQKADIDYLQDALPKSLLQSIDGTQRIAMIIGALKKFSSVDSTEKAPADINKCIRDTLVVCENDWKKVADVETELDPGLPMVPCFKGEINEALLNLLLNAAHAIQEKLGKDAQEKGTISISTLKTDDSVEIHVQDTGTGIPDDIRSHVFDQFFTTKEVGAGTGQGLSVAYNVVKKHDGQISFESSPDEGTTFTIRLPL